MSVCPYLLTFSWLCTATAPPRRRITGAHVQWVLGFPAVIYLWKRCIGWTVQTQNLPQFTISPFACSLRVHWVSIKTDIKSVDHSEFLCGMEVCTVCQTDPVTFSTFLCSCMKPAQNAVSVDGSTGVAHRLQRVKQCLAHNSSKVWCWLQTVHTLF